MKKIQKPSRSFYDRLNSDIKRYSEINPGLTKKELRALHNFAKSNVWISMYAFYPMLGNDPRIPVTKQLDKYEN